MICAFIDAHRDRFGVVPICRALSAHGCQIAPRTYWARQSRPPSARAVRDAELTARIAALRRPGTDGRRRPEALYGSLKTWAWLRRQGGLRPLVQFSAGFHLAESPVCAVRDGGRKPG